MAKKFSLKLGAGKQAGKQGQGAGKLAGTAAKHLKEQDPFQVAPSDEEDFSDSQKSLSSEDIDLEDAPAGQLSSEEGTPGEDGDYDDLGTDELGIADDEFDQADEEAPGSQGSDDDSEGLESEQDDRRHTAARAGPPKAASISNQGHDRRVQAKQDNSQVASDEDGLDEEESEGVDDDTGEGTSVSDDDDSEGDLGGGAQRHLNRSGSETDPTARKGASVARAMAKILGRPVRTPAGGGDAATAAAAAPGKVTTRGVTGDAAILAESNTHHKRQAEEAAAAEARKVAKKARLEARQRGKMAVPKRGEDPGHDIREKALQKLATKGVVMLFNAVTKAQRAQQDAAAGGTKNASKAAKASFLAQLSQQQAGAGAPGAPALGALSSLGGAPVSASEGGVLGLMGRGKASAATQGVAAPAGGAGWDVLKADFTGLAGSGKMKDWDKPVDEDAAENVGQADEDDSGDDDGW